MKLIPFTLFIILLTTNITLSSQFLANNDQYNFKGGIVCDQGTTFTKLDGVALITSQGLEIANAENPKKLKYTE